MKKFFLYLCITLGFFSVSIYAEEDNAFIVCDNSLEMFHWDLDFIRQANHSIEMSACFAGGTIFRELAETLEKRMDECPNLQLFFLTTPILLEHEDKEILKRFEKKYKNRFHLQHSSTVPAVFPDITGIDNHVKLLVVDETYFSCGGTNLDQSLCTEGTYTPPRNTNKGAPMGGSLPAGVRDQDIVGRGPIAKELRKGFHKLFAVWEHFNRTQNLEKNPEYFEDKSSYFPIEEKERPFVSRFETFDARIDVKSSQVKLLLGGSHQKKNVITQEYVRLIKGAKKEIQIANLYFSPTGSIFEALLDAVNRGVKLTVISNGTGGCAPNFTKYFCWANRINYVPAFYGKQYHLWEAFTCANADVKNTKIYEYCVEDILFHKKIMIVDGQRFAIGSYNLGMRSDLSDYELLVSIESEQVASEAKKVFNKDLCFSVEITPKEARGWYFDPFTSYMGEVQKKFHGLL